MPKSIPGIDPTFAMIASKWYEGQEVLEIRRDTGAMWDFDLKKHVLRIQENNHGNDFIWSDIAMRSGPSSPALILVKGSMSQCLSSMH